MKQKINSFFSLPATLLSATLSGIRERYGAISLRFKIAFFVVVLMTCTSFILSLITVQIMNRYLQNEIIKRAESIGKSIAASAGYSLLSEDVLGLDNLVFKAKSSNHDIEYVTIITPDHKTLVHSDMAQSGRRFPDTSGRLIRRHPDGTTVYELTMATGSMFEIAYPIIFMKKPLGTVVLAINKSVLLQAQAEVRDGIFVVFSVILILGAIASVLLASFIIKPIQELSAGVTELKEGLSQKPLKIYSDDELGRLTINFNEMSSTIALQQRKLNQYARDLEDAYVSIVRVVAAAIDAKDPYTHGHSARVAKLSLMIGEAIGLSDEALKDLEMACLFHDVGKIKTPDSILLKPDILTTSENQEMLRHAEDGAAILDRAPSLRKYIPAVRHHHERQDGKGYPDGLSGDQIPLFAAIIAIADSYDAMTTNRPYRAALSKEQALRELVRVAGAKLRSDLVAVFVGLVEKQTSIKNVTASGSIA